MIGKYDVIPKEVAFYRLSEGKGYIDFRLTPKQEELLKPEECVILEDLVKLHSHPHFEINSSDTLVKLGYLNPEMAVNYDCSNCGHKGNEVSSKLIKPNIKLDLDVFVASVDYSCNFCDGIIYSSLLRDANVPFNSAEWVTKKNLIGPLANLAIFFENLDKFKLNQEEKVEEINSPAKEYVLNIIYSAISFSNNWVAATSRLVS